MTDKNYIYLAAGLFNGDTNMFNAYVASKLESMGYNCYLPQRDGFEVAEFVKFIEIAMKSLPSKKATEIAHYVPYYLDLGFFMSQSQAVIVNLDDPVDDGSVIESVYAKFSNLPVIGIRTDLRSPIGNVVDTIGINPFPVEQCDIFIKSTTPTGDYTNVLKTMDKLILKIESSLKILIPKKKNNMKNSKDPIIQNIIKGSEILFNGIKDIHSKESMEEITNRYIKNEDFFDKLAPQTFSI